MSLRQHSYLHIHTTARLFAAAAAAAGLAAAVACWCCYCCVLLLQARCSAVVAPEELHRLTRYIHVPANAVQT
jgi:hypothetical protein